MGGFSSIEKRWQKKLNCPNVGKICWCDICTEIEKRIHDGINEARDVLKKHIETKEDSPEKDAMQEVLSLIISMGQ